MEKKNLLLQPIFRDLKSAIRHMTFTEEYKLMKEYIDNRNLILSQFGNSIESEKCREGLNLLEKEYARLLKRQKDNLYKEPGKKIRMTQRRLEDMF